MDNSTVALPETRIQSTNVNGSARRPSPVPAMSPVGRPTSLMDSQNQSSSLHVVQVVVNRDERGYGMKVSGDNPVYVQSVKEGGAAEKAGLHAGDKIIKVNDVNVISSKHTDVVDLIRASSQVILTVQQRTGPKAMGSPSLHNRSLTSSGRITAPKPVDHEKQHQLQLQKEQYIRLMIEKQQRYIDELRSQVATIPDENKMTLLSKTEQNLQKLLSMIPCDQNEQSPQFPNLPCSPPLPSRKKSAKSPNGNSAASPPPLPKRNQQRPSPDHHNTVNNRHYMNGQSIKDTNTLFLNNEINANIDTPVPCRRGDGEDKEGSGGARRHPRLSARSLTSPDDPSRLVDNPLYYDNPPPLPPRAPLSAPVDREPDAVNSINKQMSYPLVATCATLVNDYSPNPTHHRTKSSPESLLTLSAAEASQRLIASESMSDLSRQDGWDPADTPPGTPPPPYPSPPSSRRKPYSTENGESTFEETIHNICSSPDASPSRGLLSHRIFASSSPIHAATPPTAQQPIISMEDDEISDPEMGQLEDHGYFQSLSRLWEHQPHLAVFMNFILSNSDPNSLLFYLLTDLYKEGNAKEMRKWAFEIHSCFLVPGAPLGLSNVDENIAREIDDVLSREFDKEEILRKIFWKARSRAKEELTNQLADFQQKRTAGLGTIFGPKDQALAEIYNDKTKEIKLYESLFLEKLDPYLEEVEKENYDPKKYYTAAALTTVLVRIFGVRPTSHNVDRCPTFVSKEKSFRTKFIGRYSRKLNIQGHQFVAQQYYTVIQCNHCHQIIYGIGPQGYQCSVCLINLHRTCVKLYDDTCPGPMNKKDRGIGKFIRIRPHENSDHRRKHSSHFIQMERERRQAEDKENSMEITDSGESKPSQPVSRSGSDRRPDVVREEISKNLDGAAGIDHHGHEKTDSNATTPDGATNHPQSSGRKKPSSHINRSESYKEQTEKRKQKRNISDPIPNTISGDVDFEHHGLSNTESGSSSNSSISYNGRLSESPSNSADAVVTDSAAGGTRNSASDWESEPEVQPSNVSQEEMRNLSPHEKERQDVINELFHTENTHVRSLRVLYEIFYKNIEKSQTLKAEELSLIFPNINEVLNVHKQLNKEMKKKRQEDPLVGNLGDMLIGMFGGATGETVRKAAAVFCERQQLALEFIKDKRKKDSKFDMVLAECEKKRQCRRLPFQGIVPTEMQRLSKYPLLLKRLISSIEANPSDTDTLDELGKLKKAHELTKDILNYVNEAAKLALNRHRLEDIQRHLDQSNFERMEHPLSQEYRTLDLTKYKLIHEGLMHLRRPNKGPVPVHILLLEEAVVILQKEGDKFLLKYFQSGSQAQPQPLSPIIKMSTLLVRNNAVCKNALFLVNTSANNSQMYDLLAEDDSKRDMWIKYFADAAESHNKREGKTKRSEPPPDSDESETVQELVDVDLAEKAETVPGDDDEEQHFSDAQDEQPEIRDSSEGGGIRTRVTADEWPLIQPSQVHVQVPPVHTAESRLTPLEQIRRKDEEVRRALEDKEGLVADLLSIPREHFQVIADMAGDTQDSRSSRDISELVMASVYQVNQLHAAVNEALNVTEAAPVVATGGKLPACQSQETMPTVAPPSIAAHVVRDIANKLSSQLTTLLSDVKKVEEERDRFRKELHRLRETLHESESLHGPNNCGDSPSPSPEVQQDLDNSKDSPTNKES